MLQAGKNLLQADDLMVKIQVEQLYHSIRTPKPEIEMMIRQLRLVKTLDAKRYTLLKRNLPYFVCGIFNPPHRKIENFAWISHFVLDFDHLNDKGISTNELKFRLASDPKILLLFVSPGNDGLKVLFRLDEKCHDHGKYSLFYKLFAKSFAQKYGLDQVLDPRTSDVSRACFISVDPDVYFNPQAETVQMSSFVDFGNADQVSDLRAMLKQQQAEIKSIELKADNQAIDDEALNKIKATLNPGLKTRQEKHIYIPEEIDKVINLIIQRMNELGITTTETIGINYGKKIRLKLGLKLAEINIFYGKKGYSVVQTPRNGTDNALNELTARIIADILL